MFAYCENDPVNRSDPKGSSFIRAIIWTAVDIYHLINQDIQIVGTADNLKIENSYLINTPWVQLGISLNINYFSPDYKDTIQGSSAGMVFEWMCHNAAFAVYSFASLLGKDVHNKVLAAGSVDMGATIFHDNTHGKMGTFMKAAYWVLSPISAFIDHRTYKNIQNSGNQTNNSNSNHKSYSNHGGGKYSCSQDGMQ